MHHLSSQPIRTSPVCAHPECRKYHGYLERVFTYALLAWVLIFLGLFWGPFFLAGSASLLILAIIDFAIRGCAQLVHLSHSAP